MFLVRIQTVTSESTKFDLERENVWQVAVSMATLNMDFLQWSCHDVAEWIDSLGFPQYRVRRH